MVFCEPEKCLIAVLGPTACGKTDLSMEIARNFSGEIVNCDSRQIYQHLAIGTAAPTETQKREIPHHLFSFLSPSHAFSAGDYVCLAREQLEVLWKKKKVPVLVGGTGFYYEALISGLPEEKTNTEVREKLVELLSSRGLEHLVRELLLRDPAAESSVDLKNPRRVSRALELIITEGKPLKEIHFDRVPLDVKPFCLILTRPRNELHARIHKRVDRMVEQGLELEVKSLSETFGFASPGLATIGYKEWQDFFLKRKSKEEIIEKIKAHTRQYAKRQETWFRHRINGTRLDLSGLASFQQIFELVRDFLKTYS